MDSTTPRCTTPPQKSTRIPVFLSSLHHIRRDATIASTRCSVQGLFDTSVPRPLTAGLLVLVDASSHMAALPSHDINTRRPKSETCSGDAQWEAAASANGCDEPWTRWP